MLKINHGSKYSQHILLTKISQDFYALMRKRKSIRKMIEYFYKHLNKKELQMVYKHIK